ncbi:MAG: N-acetylmuramoyl-L-alanine amidase [Ignavibacteriales bacterium]|nr:N-acetylmuramoyl-L-alanine amidase [Ignavibacteriales bacterium]
MKRSVLLAGLFLPLLAFGQTDLSGLKFCIDPGHGGFQNHVSPDPGIDFYESVSNFEKALHLQALLEAQGAVVIRTRTVNSDNPSLSARSDLANENNVDWFHSIHSNAYNQITNYTLILFRGYDNQPVFPQAKTMGNIMAQRIWQFLRTDSYQNRGDWTFYGNTSGLGVLRELTMPGELSEGSFHDVPTETRRLLNNDYRKIEAYALLKSFMEYYNASPDTFGIIAGIQTDVETGVPKNQTRVRLLPENRIYEGDSFNNGFFMFDSLVAGSYSLVFETPLYRRDTVDLNVTAGSVNFVDRTLVYSSFPTVISTTPDENDTTAQVAGPISIRFSRAMDTASVRQAVSFTPAATAALQWSTDLKTASIVPDPPLQYYTWYTVTLDSSAKADNGFKVDLDGDEVGGDVFSFTFKTETGLQVPSLSFGAIKLNDTASLNLVLRNRAPYQITIQNFTGLSQPFSTVAFPDTIPGSDSLVVPVSFIPTSYGSFSNSITVSADSGTVVTSISGSSPSPSLFLSHTFLGFGSVSTDTTRNRPMFLTTTSVNGARIDSLYTRTSFFQFAPQLSFPYSLEPGDTIHATVTFAPQTQGSFTDSLVILNNGSVSVARVSLAGNGIISVVEVLPGIVDRFDLLQNYPNPFNPETLIEFLIAQTSPVWLDIVDLLGRSVRHLVSGEYQPGRYRAVWDGRDDAGRRVASGVYFYRLSAGSFVASRRMVLVK